VEFLTANPFFTAEKQWLRQVLSDLRRVGGYDLLRFIWPLVVLAPDKESFTAPQMRQL
jgi:hypothetical protein